MSFASLGLAPTLLSALERAGFTQPTPVQEAAIPRALAGKDLMVSSQTGSGKTAAFMLPLLHRIAQQPANKGSGVQVLVLTPTRELALQVAEATRLYGAGIAGLRIATVVGGMPYGAQIKALSRRVDVLVATPGRLIDHLQARRVNLSTVHALVLDEADRMLDMGFIEEIEAIIARLPAERQSLLFSATFEGSVAQLASRLMREPERLSLAGQKARHENIDQKLLYADDGKHKQKLLDHLLRDTELDQAIVFTSTKRGADELADILSAQGHAAAALHGDMNQRQRSRTLGLLQGGKLRILVATDVAARGIDVQGISHAINYDLPMQAEDYVHRIGRTGRAGRNGRAYTFATHTERHKIRRIEHFIGRSIPMEEIAGLEPQQRAARSFGKRPTPGSGYRGSRPNRDGYGNRESYGKRDGQGAGYARRDSVPSTEGHANRENHEARGSFVKREGYEARGGYAKREGQEARSGYAKREGQETRGGYAKREGHEGRDGYRSRESQSGREQRPEWKTDRGSQWSSDRKSAGDNASRRTSRPTTRGYGPQASGDRPAGRSAGRTQRSYARG